MNQNTPGCLSAPGGSAPARGVDLRTSSAPESGGAPAIGIHLISAVLSTALPALSGFKRIVRER